MTLKDLTIMTINLNTPKERIECVLSLVKALFQETNDYALLSLADRIQWRLDGPTGDAHKFGSLEEALFGYFSLIDVVDVILAKHHHHKRKEVFTFLCWLKGVHLGFYKQSDAEEYYAEAISPIVENGK